MSTKNELYVSISGYMYYPTNAVTVTEATESLKKALEKKAGVNIDNLNITSSELRQGGEPIPERVSNDTMLSDQAKESIYREVERNYAREDARCHLIDMKGEEYASSISDETIEDIVNEYFDIHDCNIPENSLWEAAIEYILED